jgi:hypothetical protein
MYELRFTVQEAIAILLVFLFELNLNQIIKFFLSGANPEDPMTGGLLFLLKLKDITEANGMETGLSKRKAHELFPENKETKKTFE